MWVKFKAHLILAQTKKKLYEWPLTNKTVEIKFENFYDFETNKTENEGKRIDRKTSENIYSLVESLIPIIKSQSFLVHNFF